MARERWCHARTARGRQHGSPSRCVYDSPRIKGIAGVRTGAQDRPVCHLRTPGHTSRRAQPASDGPEPSAHRDRGGMIRPKTVWTPCRTPRNDAHAGSIERLGASTVPVRTTSASTGADVRRSNILQRAEASSDRRRDGEPRIVHADNGRSVVELGAVGELPGDSLDENLNFSQAPAGGF